MKTLIALVMLFMMAITVQAQTTNAAPAELVIVQSTYQAQNVPASDLSAKMAAAQAQCPAGSKVAGIYVSLNPKTGLYFVNAIYK